MTLPPGPPKFRRRKAERRDEIVESCRRRGVHTDVDAAVAAHEETTRLRTEPQECNERRKEHQVAGKKIGRAHV